MLNKENDYKEAILKSRIFLLSVGNVIIGSALLF